MAFHRDPTVGTGRGAPWPTRLLGVFAATALALSPAFDAGPAAATEPADPITADPAVLDFGEVQLGQWSPSLPTTLTNHGDVTMTVVGSHAPFGAGFSLDPSCPDGVTPPGGSCTVHIELHPDVAGAGGGTFWVVFDTGHEEPIQLSWTIADPVTASPDSLAFGEVQVGAWSPSLPTVLTNHSAVTMTVVGIAPPGLPNSAGFTFDPSCPGGVTPPGGSCTVHVDVLPGTVGPVSTTVWMAYDNGHLEPLTLTWTGIGGPPVVDVAPAQLSFGVVEPGQHPIRRVTVTNRDEYEPQDLGVASVGLSGPDTTSFLLYGDTCTGATLGPGESCHMDWQFVGPAGPSEATVSVNSTSPDSPHQVPLTAFGNLQPISGIVLSLTDGRSYGALVWGFDPNDGRATRIRMTIPGVVTRETEWNYWWADMPRFTGYDRHEAHVFLARLPAGTHHVCFDALDGQSRQWHSIGCRTHTVK